MTKVAIHGKAGTGKDTLAWMIIDYYNKINPCLFSDMYAFADPVKKTAQTLFPDIPYEWLWGESKLRNNIILGAFDSDGNPLTVRKLLTDIGKFGRAYNNKKWINITLEEIRDKIICHGGKSFFPIISDLRFKDEFAALEEESYFLIRVKRKDQMIVDDISEIDLDSYEDSKFNYVIENDFGLDYLQGHVEKLFEIWQVK